MPNLVKRLQYESEFSEAISIWKNYAKASIEASSTGLTLPRSLFVNIRKKLRDLLTPIVEQVAADSAFVMDDEVQGNVPADVLMNLAKTGSPKMADMFAQDFVADMHKKVEDEEEAAQAIFLTYLLSLDYLTQPSALERRSIEYVVETMTNAEGAVANVVNDQLEIDYAVALDEPENPLEALDDDEQDSVLWQQYMESNMESSNPVIATPSFETFVAQAVGEAVEEADDAPIDEVSQETYEDLFSLDDIYDEIDFSIDDYQPRETLPKPPYTPGSQFIETYETDKLPPLPFQEPLEPSPEAFEIVNAGPEPNVDDYKDAFEQYLIDESKKKPARVSGSPKLIPLWRTQEDGKVCKTCEPLNGKPKFDWPVWAGEGPQAHPNCRCYLEWAYYVDEQPLHQ